jgi:predicted SAM-dependent methyltransferase
VTVSGFGARAKRRLRRTGREVRRRLVRLDPRLDTRDIRDATPERFVRATYQIVLRRSGDPHGIANYVGVLEDGRYSVDDVLDEFITSMELRNSVPFRNRTRSMHQSRCDFVRMLPKARRILDLGGTDQNDPVGSLVSMGYPYPFELLTIVDLPHEERHDLYTSSAPVDVVESPMGPVEYRYHSMTDLSAYDDASFDLVFSGETIEHVTVDDARSMLRQVRRVLAPRGWFCLDTPNRRATELELGELYSNPDHKIEYTHGELRSLLSEAGFDVVGAYGLTYVGASLAAGKFDGDEAARMHGVYADVENSYLLAYMCRVSGPSPEGGR